MPGGADNLNSELRSYIIGTDSAGNDLQVLWLTYDRPLTREDGTEFA